MTTNRGNSTGKNSGALLVDKPVGPTSHDVVARARRALGERSIGHTGTLDPLASGLLLLLTGRATRLASLLGGALKTYDATVRLGFSTDTFDAAGERQPLEAGIAPAAIDDAAVDEVVEALRQQRQQMPPAFSAKKVGGVRAYKLARRNETPELRAVDVCVYALDWKRAAADVLHLTLTCSAGYYVRAMAQEIGERLGCGAHLEALRRTRVGAFDVTNAVPLDVLEREGGDAAAARLLAMESLLPDLPSVTLTEDGLRRASHGNVLGVAHVSRWSDAASGSGPLQSAAAGPIRYRVLSPEGALLAIAQANPGGLQPVIVLAAAG
ncbi:MAG: tRNA pseudouridine(55) synthase TruB [Acidobacteriota bacterium]|nr:tRNA pseudouridine(55) synthase TruB [Acidobacteriota bacterium]